MKHGCVAAAAVAIAFAGCGGDSSGPVTSARYFARVREAACDHEVRCGGWDDTLACRTYYDRLLAPTLPRLQQRLADGTIVFDPIAAQACIDQAEVGPCEEVPRAWSLPCSAVFHGTRPDGAACYEDDECAGGDCALPPPGCSDACCRGTCATRMPPAAIGAPCERFVGPCVDDAHCDVTGTCVPLHGVGGACTSVIDCQLGLACADTPGTCQVPPRLGEPCLRTRDFASGGTTPTCFTVGLTCDATTQTCVVTPGLDEPCDGRACALGLACVAGTCRRAAALGQPCTDLPCTPGFYCPTETAQPICRPFASPGEPCTRGAECAEGSCTDHVCAELFPTCE